MSEQVKELVPKLRFPEFENDGEWQEKPFDEVFSRITSKNQENNLNVLTISAQMGLVSQLDYFNKSVSAKDVSGYYLIQKGDFAYNKSYSQGYPVGAIKLLKNYEKGVVSTLYICFRAKVQNVKDNFFFEQYFDAGLLNPQIEGIAQEGARNHGLLNLSVVDFFELTKLYLPKAEERKKIADCLSSLDDLITAQNQKVEALKQHKKSLMQHLFPAEGETIPKLRFPEFENDGEWNEIKLSELLETVIDNRGKTPPLSEGGYPLVEVNALGQKSINYEKICKYVNEITYQSWFRGHVKAGDVLFSTVGAIAECSLVGSTNSPVIAQNIVGLRFNQSVQTEFAIYLLTLEKNKEKFIRITMGAVQPSLKVSQMVHLKFMLPKLNEQTKIAECLSSLDELITIQIQQLEAYKAHKKGLMQQLFPALDDCNT